MKNETIDGNAIVLDQAVLFPNVLNITGHLIFDQISSSMLKNSNLYVAGDVILDGVLELYHSNFLIGGNLSLSGNTILNSSTINVTGCIHLEGNLTLKVPPRQNQTSFNILTSSQSCITGTFDFITILSDDPCETLQTSYNGQALTASYFYVCDTAFLIQDSNQNYILLTQI